MEPPMTCRLHRVVATLLVLAAGAQAAEQITFKSGHSEQSATVADELQILPATAQAHPVGLPVVGGRTGVSATARRLLASGEAKRASPVVYLDGHVGDPAYRAVASRQMMVAAAPGTDIATLVRDHGLRLIAAVPGLAGNWMAEPLSGDVLASLDAVRALGADPRCTVVWPQMEMPVSQRLVPNDPLLTDGYIWHLANVAPGIHANEVWDYFTGTGAAVAIIDGGIQIDHLDLWTRYDQYDSRDYINNDFDPRPTGDTDNHGTAVAGLALATGNNSVGTLGVAWNASFIASKLLNVYNSGRDSATTTLGSDSVQRLALTTSTVPTSVSQAPWVANCSWGPIDDALNQGVIGPQALLGMLEATTFGRQNRGTVLVFPAGNGGVANPNALRPGWPTQWPLSQDCTAWDGYLNRFVIGVGAYDSLGRKGVFSETGPNLTISAPGVALTTTDRSDRSFGNPNPAADTKGYTIWPQLNVFNDADFNGDLKVWRPNEAPGPDNLPYENGDYTLGFSGTSAAAPIVSGAAALMLQARPTLSWLDVRQIMIHRGQDYLPLPFGVSNPVAPHDDWGHWRANSAGLLYNNFYGFGGVDLGRFVFGADGTTANLATIAGRDEPGAMRWPLLPAMSTVPLSYEESYPVPVDDSRTALLDPYAVRDAPLYTYNPDGTEKNLINRDLVWNPGRILELFDPRSRAVDLRLPITIVPDRFRIDAVEVTVRLDDVGDTTYRPNTWPKGALGGFRSGDYVFSLTSPGGATCLIGRQRPGMNIPEGGSYQQSFTELFHTNETATGVWVLSVLDETNSLNDDPVRDPVDRNNNTFVDPEEDLDNDGIWDGALNPPQCRVGYAAIRIYGHQTYDTPRLTGTGTPGVPSDEGDQTVELDGSAFAVSGGGVGVTQAYWMPTAPTAGPPVEIPTTVSTSTRVRVSVPASLLSPASPGTGTVFLANPAVVVGRAGGTDAFDTPNIALPTTVQLPSQAAVASTRPMKRCPGGDDKTIKYSRRPTLTPLSDIVLQGAGPFSLSTFAYDPDVQAGLPNPGTAETLTVTVTSFNPAFAAMSAPGSPGGNGIGTWTINGSLTSSDSGFALIQVRATDGVTTATRSFRVIIQSTEDANGCGGGMGLALLGVPLLAWFIRRRRRS